MYASGYHCEMGSVGGSLRRGQKHRRSLGMAVAGLWPRGNLLEPPSQPGIVVPGSSSFE